MSSHGTVAWTEFNTFDVAGARAYYGAVFGWEFEAMPHQDGSEYTICKKDGQPVAGIFDMTPVPMLKGIPSHWLTYFAVEDMTATVEAVKAAGGSLRRAPFDTPAGKIAIVEDATGGVCAYMQPA